MSRTTKKAYTKSKKVSKECRNHGSCPYCENNRLYSNKKKDEASKNQLEDL